MAFRNSDYFIHLQRPPLLGTYCPPLGLPVRRRQMLFTVNRFPSSYHRLISFQLLFVEFLSSWKSTAIIIFIVSHTIFYFSSVNFFVHISTEEDKFHLMNKFSIWRRVHSHMFLYTISVVRFFFNSRIPIFRCYSYLFVFFWCTGRRRWWSAKSCGEFHSFSLPLLPQPMNLFGAKYRHCHRWRRRPEKTMALSINTSHRSPFSLWNVGFHFSCHLHRRHLPTVEIGSQPTKALNSDRFVRSDDCTCSIDNLFF